MAGSNQRIWKTAQNPATSVTAATEAPVLSPAEIQKKLDENKQWLDLWEKLLDKSDADGANVSAVDAMRHREMNARLHENLEVLTRIVKKQIAKKPPIGGWYKIPPKISSQGE